MSPGRNAPSFHVYYGAELLEVVSEDRQHPAYKLLVARLYNAGVKGLALQRHFQVDRKTMQRWGRALQSGDAEQLVQALAGRGGRRKLTPEIRAFVRVRFPEIYGQSRVGYSQRLRTEIERVFALKLSGECLRPLLKCLRAELRQECPELGVAGEMEKREIPCVCPPESPTVAVENPGRDFACGPAEPAAEPSQGISRFSGARSGLARRPILPSSGPVAFQRRVGGTGKGVA